MTMEWYEHEHTEERSLVQEEEVINVGYKCDGHEIKMYIPY